MKRSLEEEEEQVSTTTSHESNTLACTTETMSEKHICDDYVDFEFGKHGDSMDRLYSIHLPSPKALNHNFEIGIIPVGNNIAIPGDIFKQIFSYLDPHINVIQYIMRFVCKSWNKVILTILQQRIVYELTSSVISCTKKIVVVDKSDTRMVSETTTSTTTTTENKEPTSLEWVYQSDRGLFYPWMKHIPPTFGLKRFYTKKYGFEDITKTIKIFAIEGYTEAIFWFRDTIFDWETCYDYPVLEYVSEDKLPKRTSNQLLVEYLETPSDFERWYAANVFANLLQSGNVENVSKFWNSFSRKFAIVKLHLTYAIKSGNVKMVQWVNDLMKIQKISWKPVHPMLQKDWEQDVSAVDVEKIICLCVDLKPDRKMDDKVITVFKYYLKQYQKIPLFDDQMCRIRWVFILLVQNNKQAMRVFFDAIEENNVPLAGNSDSAERSFLSIAKFAIEFDEQELLSTVFLRYTENNTNATKRSKMYDVFFEALCKEGKFCSGNTKFIEQMTNLLLDNGLKNDLVHFQILGYLPPYHVDGYISKFPELLQAPGLHKAALSVKFLYSSSDELEQLKSRIEKEMEIICMDPTLVADFTPCTPNYDFSKWVFTNE